MSARNFESQPYPINERARLEGALRSIHNIYDSADRQALDVFSGEVGPIYISDASDCIEALRREYGEECMPGNVSLLFKRANKTARKKEEKGHDDVEDWRIFSNLFDKYHGTEEFRSKIEPGTQDQKDQMTKARLFDSALYLIAQMTTEVEDPRKWI